LSLAEVSCRVDVISLIDMKMHIVMCLRHTVDVDIVVGCILQERLETAPV
jgi:hypothetical protein